MPRLSAEPIMMTPAHEQVPTRLVRAHTTPRKLAERAQLILLTAAGTSVRETARQLGVWPKTARHWLRRWRAAAESTQIAQRLADAPRPGAPATFAPEQICAIPGTSPGTALACERPAEASDLPLSHWSRSELARCASRLRRGRLSQGQAWDVVCDNLNTHLSEGMVRLVAKQCGIEDDPRPPPSQGQAFAGAGPR